MVMAGTAVTLVIIGVILFTSSRPQPSPADMRTSEILEAAERTRGGALLIGDSITEGQKIDELCGLRVLNAGISGSRVHDWAQLAPKLVEKVRPELVVYALGVNDVAHDPDLDVARWADAYEQLRRVPAPRVHVLGVLEAEGQFSRLNQRIARMNSILSRQPGYIRPFDTRGSTIDGLHLNARGKSRWTQTLRGIC